MLANARRARRRGLLASQSIVVAVVVVAIVSFGTPSRALVPPSAPLRTSSSSSSSWTTLWRQRQRRRRARSHDHRARSVGPTMYFDDVSRHTFYWSLGGSDDEDGSSGRRRRLRPPDDDVDGEYDGLSPADVAELKRRYSRDKMEALRRVLNRDLERRPFSFERRTRTTTEEDSEDDADDDSDDAVVRRTTAWASRHRLVGDDESEHVFERIASVRVGDASSVPAALADAWETAANVTARDDDARALREAVVLVAFPRAGDGPSSYEDWARLVAAIEYGRDSCDGDDDRARFGVALFHPEYRRAPYLLYPRRFSPVPTLGFWRWDDDDDRVARELDVRVRAAESAETSGSVPVDAPSPSPSVEVERRALERLFRDGTTRVAPGEERCVESTREWLAAARARRALDGDGPLVALDRVDPSRAVVSRADDAATLFADVWRAVADDAGAEGVLVLAPRYAPRDAPAFRRFAVAVSAVLKRLCAGGPALELLHPEYAGTRERDDAARRSPFPSLQIVWEDES